MKFLEQLKPIEKKVIEVTPYDPVEAEMQIRKDVLRVSDSHKIYFRSVYPDVFKFIEENRLELTSLGFYITINQGSVLGELFSGKDLASAQISWKGKGYE